MTLAFLADLLRSGSLDLLATVTRASLEGAALALLVGLTCRLVPVLPAAVRAWLWWLVCLKLLVGLLPVPIVPVAWLPHATPTWTPAAQVQFVPLPEAAPPASTSDGATSPHDVATATPAAGTTPAAATIPYASLWPVVLCVLWLSALIAHGRGFLCALRATRDLLRRAEPAPAVVARRLISLVHRFALPVVPEVLASRLAAGPMLTGVLRPSIVLPASAPDTLSRAELDLVLAHELAHVRRGDLVWGWVPAVAARVFFFHPLARLATREYLAAREEACDAEVLQTLDAEPSDYGRLLVKLGVAPSDDVLAAAGASPSFTALKRRLIMLDRARTGSSRWWWTLAGATAVLVPLTLVAQPVATATTAASADRQPVAPAQTTARATVGDWPPPSPPEPPLPPAPPDAPPPPPDGLDDWNDVPSAPPEPVEAPPAAPPAPPAPPMPPVPPADAQDSRHEGHRRIQSPWVILEPGSPTVTSSTSASSDRAAAERNRTSADEPLLWFRYQGTPYVTRDAATIAAVRSAFAPVTAAGRRMGDIGERQGRVGEQQAALGARQAELGARQAALAAEIAQLAAERLAAANARLRDRSAQRTTESDDAWQKELDARRRELDTQMQALGEQQRVLGEQMRAMGETMRAEGAPMKEAGRTLEAALTEADARATAIFGEAVAKGTATRAK